MSKNTKATIKTVLTITLGMASIYVYSDLVTDYVLKQIDSYFE